MDVTITDKKEMNVLSRTEITGEMAYQGKTPSRADVAEAIAKKLSVDKSLVVVRNIENEFGFSTAKITASVYKDKDSLAQYESEFMKKRHARESKDKPAEKKEEKAEDNPEEKAPETEDKPAEKKEEKAEDKPEEKAPKTEDKPAEKKEEKPADKTEKKASE